MWETVPRVKGGTNQYLSQELCPVAQREAVDSWKMKSQPKHGIPGPKSKSTRWSATAVDQMHISGSLQVSRRLPCKWDTRESWDCAASRPLIFRSSGPSTQGDWEAGQGEATLDRVGFTKEGKLLALDLELYCNGGNSMDLSRGVMERAVLHSDNVYVIPNISVKGNVCVTNQPSNTAFRGFGGPQGMLVAEMWMDHIAATLGKPTEEIRALNLQSEGYELHYGQKLTRFHVPKMWNELKDTRGLDAAQREVDEYNSKNKWRKRGLAMVPTKYGISFGVKFLNQAGALVHIYTDGTVLVTHGGVEMGQGLHTKVAQVAATCLGVPLSSVFISETSTDKVPNASPTAASASSDLYGGAVMDACQQLNARMQPVKNRFPPGTSLGVIADACHKERIDLSAHGFYVTPGIDFDWSVGRGSPYAYFTSGVAIAEVEIDALTGDFHVIRVDIFMDIGKPLNPAIDIGQIEGAFVQGMGWATIEELKWGDIEHPWIRPGHLFTQGPGAYKIPTVNDIPIDFRVTLLKEAPNPRGILSSKAVGEPPLFLSASVFFAVKDAIAAARRERGLKGWFALDSPATPERIRMACADEFTAPFAGPDLRPKISV
ncbi:hypothetical protein CBR_g30957 [Chara braunii]|uniref:Uncharacterized protein n=1 Tax=Chara braunii TaxID=69332 RepID=A0A388LDW7_CHABU|nr:hypothetical protein CBR_g30957 [Chara braunii]|eukprot:GBG80495.1 hypothetical protein CBR_g30957 [Chara braunii]